MEGKKRKSKKRKSARRMHGFEGFAGKKKRAKVMHKVVMRGDPGISPVDVGIDMAGLLAGAIGLSFIASFLPIPSAKIKALIPMAAGMTGLLVPAVAENRFLSRLALGALAVGGYSLTKQMLPKLPLMGAADTAEGIGYAIQNLPPEEKAILGILPEETPQLEHQGDRPEDMLGETEMIEGVPGEMLGNAPGEMLGMTEEIQGSEPGEMLGTTETIGGGEGSDFE